ncbi:MAG: lysophospholipid acyltransferase family protein [bacterium]|jgi:1-acyl-sn-glycerol-3-phosphate acyltransferase
MKLRWRLAWLATYPLARLFFRLRVSGREELHSLGNRTGIIIAANHSSNFDPLIVGWAAAREIYFLAKEELFRYRPFAWLISKWNALPISRAGMDIAALRRCSTLLRKKRTLVLFPEGTRSPTGELGSFKPGVGMLAVLNSVPVVPCLIAGVNRSIISWLVDRDFVRRGLRSRPEISIPIVVRFGAPVLPIGFDRNRNGYQQFTRLLENRFREMAD